MAPPKALFCPICRKVVPLGAEDFPFCSERCRTIDLAKWASGDYKISSPILDPEVLEGLADSMPRQRKLEDDSELSPEQRAANFARRLLDEEEDQRG